MVADIAATIGASCGTVRAPSAQPQRQRSTAMAANDETTPQPRSGCRVRHRSGAQFDNRGVAMARAAAESWSVLDIDELMGLGFTKRVVARLVRDGWLHLFHRGVYAVGHPNVPRQGHFLAAVKACGKGAVLSGYAAAAQWGAVEWDGRRVEVLVRDTTTRIHKGIRVHRTIHLDRKDIRSNDGIPLTSPARTCLDLAAQSRYPALRRIVREMVSTGVVSIRELVEILGRLPNQPGAGKLRKIVGEGVPPTRSDLEDAVLDLILEAGLSTPDVNKSLVLEGRTVKPDFRWPDRRLVVEADSRAWHDNKLAREDDAERQALLEAHGERVLRVTWRQTFAARSRTKARLLAAHSSQLST